MGEPSKLKILAWRIFFLITPRWLSRKYQMYMFRRIAEQHPDEVERKIREALPQQGRATLSKEELAALSKDFLDRMLHPQVGKQALEEARKRRGLI